ncbi:hypothetical protein [Leptospira santarosai]|uniref:hypothetical protein n=1 Tax=Leptospira santarosai TaxID=28183 RepID=UPI0024AF1307|nr:hypothetical protein [Leptospira santarosai]MDI7165955.1 hypothetical protein [Leptospira santarosai]MDO6383443.1 hypothetical protein [Leptospira santarosai]
MRLKDFKTNQEEFADYCSKLIISAFEEFREPMWEKIEEADLLEFDYIQYYEWTHFITDFGIRFYENWCSKLTLIGERIFGNSFQFDHRKPWEEY